MSTTFQIYPSSNHIPNFEELLSVSTSHLTAFLRDYQITDGFHLDVGLRRIGDESNQEQPIFREDPAWWREDQYAWFFVTGVPGGTDVYANLMTELDLSCVIDEVQSDSNADFNDQLFKALEIGRYWSFRRSAGQLATTNLVYGIIAASLAELTKGFMHSSDSAWDHRLFPALPENFLQWYFRPERAEDLGNQHWAKRCISRISSELRAASAC